MKYIYLFVLMLVSCFTNGQIDNYTDSLLKVIPAQVGLDKLKTIGELVWNSPSHSIAKTYARELIKEADKQKDYLNACIGYEKLIGFYFTDDSLLIVAKEGEEYCLKHENYEAYLLIRCNVSQRYILKGNYYLASKVAKESYDKAKEMKLPDKMIAGTLSTLAHAYMGYNDEESINYYKQSQQLMGDNINHPNYLYNYIYIIEPYKNIGDYKNALICTDSVVACLNRTVRPGYEDKDLFFVAEACYAECYSLLNDLDKAAKYLDTVQKLFEPEWSYEYHLILYETYKIYYEAKEDYSKALYYSDKMTDCRIEMGLPTKNDLNKGTILEAMGEYKQACKVYYDYIEYTDSLFFSNFGMQINELRTIYELDKAEMQVEQQRLSIKVQHNLILGLVGICLLLVLIGALVYIYNRKLRAKNRLLYKQIHEQDKLEKEIEERNTLISEKIPDTEIIKNGKLYAVLSKLMKDEKIFANPDIDRKIIANMLNTNEKYLFDTIKGNTGLSFSDYINNLRLNLAKQLLIENKKLTIDEIAYQSGFGSRVTLYRQFREKYKLSPTEFRKAASDDIKNQ